MYVYKSIYTPRTAIPLTWTTFLSAAICNVILSKSACSTRSTSRSIPILKGCLLLPRNPQSLCQRLHRRRNLPRRSQKQKRRMNRLSTPRQKKQFLESPEKLALRHRLGCLGFGNNYTTTFFDIGPIPK